MHHIPIILNIAFQSATPDIHEWRSEVLSYITATLATQIQNSSDSQITSPAISWFGESLSGLTVDDAREIVSLGGYGGMTQPTIWVLLAADHIGENAQNVLLKTLEEPPKNVSIVLAVTNSTTLLGTIHSRCQQHFFQSTALKQPSQVDSDVDTFLATISNPATSFGELVSLAAKYKDRTEAINLVHHCLKKLSQEKTPTSIQAQLLKCTLKCWQNLSQNANLALALEHWLFSFHNQLTHQT